MKPDFSGYATRNDLRCSDGRVIRANAFKHNAGTTVPLVWHHRKDSPENILGRAVLEHREDGVYTRAYFNDTEQAQDVKRLVQHGDITALSIFANGLVQKGHEVIHGNIREVSLVVAGANPGAIIDNVTISHADGATMLDEDQAVIYTGGSLEHSGYNSYEQDEDLELEHEDDETIGDIFNSMNEKQKNVVYFMIAQALEDQGSSSSAEHSDIDMGEAFYNYLQHEGGAQMVANVFEMNGIKAGNGADNTLTHDQFSDIMEDAKRNGSFRDSILEHAATYGIENIEILFPDAQAIANAPELIARRQEWVSKVLTGTKHSPFSRIKSTVADITAEEARAKGYVKGNLKKDEIVKLLKRVTTPTTIYKKQKLDRDDIVDIKDLDVVAWLKGEMRLMLDEEIARAVLIGDGREVDDEDKIDSDHIRPIATDADMYAHKVTVTSDTPAKSLISVILRARSNYRGTGSPTLYTTDAILTDFLLIEDKVGRRLYETEAALASALRVKEIIVVDPMEDDVEMVGIIVNLTDYTIGADKGGNIAMFDDFDIDYNQHKYLIETRISGALTKPKSALVIRREAGTQVVPTSPSFDGETNTITFPTVEGVEYRVNNSAVTGTLVIEETTDVEAFAKPGFMFPVNVTRDWVFVYTAG